MPELPPTDSRGNYPAREALRVVAARRLICARRALGWTQIELARRAGVRVEIERISRGGTICLTLGHLAPRLRRLLSQIAKYKN